MQYKPLNIGGAYPKKESTTLMAKKGLNLREAPQLLSADYAQEIENYLITSEGVLEKRKGIETLFDTTGTDPIYMLEKFTDDLYLYAYDDKLAVYSKAGAASTTIKTYSAASTVYSGQRYGGYFFLTNGVNKLTRVSRAIAYDALVKDFTAGQVVTGGTSTATAVVMENRVAYTPAYLTGGVGATAVIGTWQAVTNGSFKITIDGTAYDITQITFAGLADMDAVAAKIQAAIRLATGRLETCVWNVNQFIITSSSALSNSAITVTSAVSPASGTDISGAGGTAFMDSETGRGTVTAAVKGTTGIITVENISGTFQNNETLLDAKGGTATEDGAATWLAVDVNDAPIGKVLKAIGSRLFIGNLTSDSTAVAYSATDTGANPPFTNWTVGTLATDPGKLYYRNGGDVKAMESIESSVVVFAENGKWGFRTDTIDSAGTLTKIDNTTIQRIDMGGSSGVLSIPQGLFYINEGGLWQLASVGSKDVPMSTQEQLVSTLLGTKYFDNVNLDRATMAYSQKYNSIFVSVGDDSSVNNKVIVYNLSYGGFSEITGWNINCFLNDNDTIYGASAKGTEVWQCFKGDGDDGLNIGTTYIQELNVGGLNTVKQIDGIYVHGFLSPSTSINISFDIYTITGTLSEDKISYTWTASGLTSEDPAYGEAEWGAGAFGSSTEDSSLIESYSGGSKRIKNFQRIKVEITETSQVNHQITFLSLTTKEKKPIRRRNLG